jgi:lipoate synthase
MLGIGETKEEVLEVMKDLREHHCSILTLGQYFFVQLANNSRACSSA